MSTRCRISAVYEDGTVHSIYCHHDGYIKHGVGECLYTYYQDLPKIKELMSLGDMSSLGTTTEHDPEDWNRRCAEIPKTTDYFYVRCEIYKDRGDEDADALVFANKAEFLYEMSYEVRGWTDEEYHYIFMDGDWYLFADNRIDTVKLEEFLDD